MNLMTKVIKTSAISFLTSIWPILTSIVFLIMMLSSAITKQEAIAQKVEKLELIRDDINQIKIHMERIDATMEQINKNKGH